MGAVAINRKRTEDSLNFNQQSPSQASKKKRRFSFGIVSPDSNKPSSSTISRISRYPDAKAPLRREIHAPSRASLRYALPKPKPNDYSFKRRAFDALRFFTKDKEIIDLGDEEEEEPEIEIEIEIGKEAVCEDSSVEVVEPPSSSMLDSMSLVRQEAASSLEAYKKLLQSAERRNSKLEALGFEILFNEKRLSQLRQSRPKPVDKPLKVVILLYLMPALTRFGLILYQMGFNVVNISVVVCFDVKKVPDEPFIPLTEEEEAEVYNAFTGKNRRKVLVTHANSNIDITGEVLQCLTPSAWLNDEVINVYLELLKERETREPKKYLKCHFFNTFFYKKLVSDSGYNYKAVRRWTTQRKLGYALIDCDMIFVPIHRGVHWTLAVINIRDRKFLYLDSLNGVDSKILNALAKYLGDEAKEKSGKDIDVSSWDMEFVEDLPQQQNGYDCGMFMLKYIDFFSRGLGLYFSQEHMPYFRLRTAKEILRLLVMSWLRSSCSLESLQDESHYHDRKSLLDTDDDSSEEALRIYSDETATTEWLRSVPRMIMDNGTSIQEEGENIVHKLVVLERIS
uniref:Ubiquitin-like protease family profile domain-containing protein n=1 Tax=Brassica campestris TaxID=3711 RepID=M4D8E8_BRACM